ncbi:MAG: hypothetical protein HPY61_01650 [Methanotrichaceae archaeon]|nr:hypothetical protein [Methanotrichaceae archaeon]
MIPTGSKKVSRLEIKNAGAIHALVEEEREKKAAGLEEWRQQNCFRLSWDLFTLLEGPKLENPDEYVKCGDESEDDSLFIDSQLAYFDMMNRVLEHGIDDEGCIRTTGLSKEELAFATAIEHLFQRTTVDWLLRRGINAQATALGLGREIHAGELSIAVQLIDAHRGGPEWRQICETNAGQAALDARFGIPTITEIPSPGLQWINPFDEI